jgi:hypothetical protein
MNLTFLIGCIGSRLLLAFLGAKYPDEIGKLILIPAIGFIVIYVFGLRKVGIETGGKPIWWNNLRPIHALLYFVFAVSTRTNYASYAWIILVVDVLIGLIAHLLARR